MVVTQEATENPYSRPAEPNAPRCPEFPELNHPICDLRRYAFNKIYIRPKSHNKFAQKAVAGTALRPL